MLPLPSTNLLDGHLAPDEVFLRLGVHEVEVVRAGDVRSDLTLIHLVLVELDTLFFQLVTDLFVVVLDVDGLDVLGVWKGCFQLFTSVPWHVLS